MQLRSLRRLVRILDMCKMRHRFAEHFAERLFKSEVELARLRSRTHS